MDKPNSKEGVAEPITDKLLAAAARFIKSTNHSGKLGRRLKNNSFVGFDVIANRGAR